MEVPFLLKQFIKEHAEDDLNRLLLAASRYPGIDIPFVVEQIASRRRIREKLPSWYGNDNLIFPAKIAAEQCSSELTAVYKQRLTDKDVHLCDLTGGLGIDSYFFSQKVKQVTYIERYPNYCRAAEHNFPLLGADNIKVLEGDALQLYPNIPAIDVFYIDPARRGEGNKRVFALQDCEPDLPAILPDLFKYAPKVIAKLSPMADIRQTLSLLPGTTEIHVVGIRNEVKEILFVIEGNKTAGESVIYCCNYVSPEVEEAFTFKLNEEKDEPLQLADHIQTYLYEPNSSILKAGAFKRICRLGVRKLHVSSHLYTSDKQIENFPGRTFVVEAVIPFNNKLNKTLHKTIPKANITVRNFPLPAEELRKRTKISDGGEVYLFATTLADNSKVIVSCRK